MRETKGASIDCRDRNGCKPLHLALMYKRFRLATFLMRSGAALVGGRGEVSPLYVAVYHRQAAMLQAMVENGLDVTTPIADRDSTMLLCSQYVDYELLDTSDMDTGSAGSDTGGDITDPGSSSSSNGTQPATGQTQTNGHRNSEGLLVTSGDSDNMEAAQRKATTASTPHIYNQEGPVGRGWQLLPILRHQAVPV